MGYRGGLVRLPFLRGRFWVVFGVVFLVLGSSRRSFLIFLIFVGWVCVWFWFVVLWVFCLSFFLFFSCLVVSRVLLSHVFSSF